MTNTRNNDAVQNAPSNPSGRTDAQQVISEAKRLISTGQPAPDEPELKELTEGLITLYDSLFNSASQRTTAAELAGALAKHYDCVWDSIIDNARRYASTQHMDDAFPSEPNSFDVLALAGHGNVKVISFLRETVVNDWGIPRWKAIEVLCRLDDPDAESILVGVIQRKYPSRNPDILNDLRPIEKIKGQEFVQRHQLPTVIVTDKPCAHVQVDRFRGAIWARESGDEFLFEVRLECKDDLSGLWRGVDRVESRDLPVVRRLLDLADSKITELKREIG